MQCMISMLTDYKIMKLSYHSCLSYIDIVIPDMLYHLEGPYLFFPLAELVKIDCKQRAHTCLDQPSINSNNLFSMPGAIVNETV